MPCKLGCAGERLGELKMQRSQNTLDSNQASSASGSAELQTAQRDPDAIYQKGKVVARVAGAELDREAREVRIDEVYQSDTLVIPEECEFQDLRIQIQRIQFASKIERGAP